MSFQVPASHAASSPPPQDRSSSILAMMHGSSSTTSMPVGYNRPSSQVPQSWLRKPASSPAPNSNGINGQTSNRSQPSVGGLVQQQQANASGGSNIPYKLKPWVKQAQSTTPGTASSPTSSMSGVVGTGGTPYTSPQQLSSKCPAATPKHLQGVPGKGSVTQPQSPKDNLKRTPLQAPPHRYLPPRQNGCQDIRDINNTGSAAVDGSSHPRRTGLQESPYPLSLRSFAEPPDANGYAQDDLQGVANTFQSKIQELRQDIEDLKDVRRPRESESDVAEPQAVQDRVSKSIADPILSESSIAKSQDAALDAVVSQISKLESLEKRASSSDCKHFFYGESTQAPPTGALQELARKPDAFGLDTSSVSTDLSPTTTTIPLESIAEYFQEGESASSTLNTGREVVSACDARDGDLSPFEKLDAIFKDTLDKVGRLRNSTSGKRIPAPIGPPGKSLSEETRNDLSPRQSLWSLRRPHQGAPPAHPNTRPSERERASSEQLACREDNLRRSPQFSYSSASGRAMSLQNGDISETGERLRQAQAKLQAARAMSSENRQHGSLRIKLQPRQDAQSDSSSSNPRVQLGGHVPLKNQAPRTPPPMTQTQLGGARASSSHVQENCSVSLHPGSRAISEQCRSPARSDHFKSPVDANFGRSLSPEMQNLRQRRMLMMSSLPRRTPSQQKTVTEANYSNDGDPKQRYVNSEGLIADETNAVVSPGREENRRKIVNLGAIAYAAQEDLGPRASQKIQRLLKEQENLLLQDDGSTEDTSDLAGSEYSDHIRRLEKVIIEEKLCSHEERCKRDQMQHILARELAAQKDAHARDVRYLGNNMDKVLNENRRLSSLIEKLVSRMDGGDQDQAAVISKLQQIHGQQQDLLEKHQHK